MIVLGDPSEGVIHPQWGQDPQVEITALGELFLIVAIHLLCTNSTSLCSMSCVGGVFSSGTLLSVCGEQPVVSEIE